MFRSAAMRERTVQRIPAGRLAILLAGGLASAGCFGYVPADPATLPRGSEVRVHLTREGLVSLPEVPDSVVSGTLLGGGPPLTVRVPVATGIEGPLSRSIGRDLAIPMAYVARLERREFNRTRTALALAVAAVAAVLSVQAFGDGEPEGEAAPQPLPEERTWIPRFSVTHAIP